MDREKDLKRVEDAVEALARLFQGQKPAERRAALAGVELSRTAQKVLWHVVTDAPIRISDLAKQVGLSDAVVSRQVTALEDEELVARRASEADGRVALVSPTAKGRRTGARLRRAADAIFREQLEDWSRSDLADFATHLERLLHDLRR